MSEKKRIRQHEYYYRRGRALAIIKRRKARLEKIRRKENGRKSRV